MTQLAADGDRTLGPSAAIPDGTAVPFYLAARRLRIAVARVGEAFYAFDDLCPCPGSAPCPLTSGLLTGTTLMCQCHGSTFDVVTGAVGQGPATQPLRTYEVTETGGEIRATVA
jgi:3-phenylpropionate/trans-cinnamate dioxygenase ferredoxin component